MNNIYHIKYEIGDTSYKNSNMIYICSISMGAEGTLLWDYYLDETECIVVEKSLFGKNSKRLVKMSIPLALAVVKAYKRKSLREKISKKYILSAFNAIVVG